MTTFQDQKKQDDQNRFNQVAAAVTGAVVGAGVGIAGAVIMGNKKNREKISRILNNVKDDAVDYVGGIKKQAQDKKEEIKKKFIEGKVKVAKVTKSVRKSLDHAVKDVKRTVK